MHHRTPTRLSAGLATAAITFASLTALAGPASAAPAAGATCTGKVMIVDDDTHKPLGYMAASDPSQYNVVTSADAAPTYRIGTTETATLTDLSAPPEAALVGASYYGGTFEVGQMGYAVLGQRGDGDTRGGYLTWRFDPASGALTPTWRGGDGEPKPTNLYADMYKDDQSRQVSYLGVNSDRAAFEAFWTSEIATSVSATMVDPQCLAPQAITFIDTAPESAYVGRRYAASATSQSGQDVTLSSGTPGVCSVEDGTYTFLKAGTCTVVATAPGNDDYAPGKATQTIVVKQIPAVLTLSPGFDAYSGRTTSLSATVGKQENTPGEVPAGTVQFSLDGEPLGGPVRLGQAGTFSQLRSAQSADFTRKAGEHEIAAVFTPDDEVTYAGSSVAGTQVVQQSPTSTKAAVTPKQLVATVTGLPDTTPPAGKVLFRVGDDEVGTAPVVDGKAVLDRALEAGQGYSVSAEYLGDSETFGSSDSVLRNDPFLKATESSAGPKSAAGWYRTPVTVDYTCETGGADLVDGCPASDHVDQEGADQSVTRTIHAVDGGISTVTSTVSIDKTAPTVALKGVKAGERYFAKAPAATCVGADVLSGLDTCTVTTTKGANGAETVTATATDNAGNVARTSASYLVVKQAVAGATYRNGAWEVRRGRGYTVQTQGTTRPTYRLASSSTAKLAAAGKRTMVRTGKDTWAYGATMNMPRSTSGIWYLGVQTGRTVTPIKVRMVG